MRPTIVLAWDTKLPPARELHQRKRTGLDIDFTNIERPG